LFGTILDTLALEDLLCANATLNPVDEEIVDNIYLFALWLFLLAFFLLEYLQQRRKRVHAAADNSTALTADPSQVAPVDEA
jgi:hypothetical protein